ncbi:MAG TPA: ABC transporter ATP-binding protein [Jatrophihabitans sp.]|nr:ABC transporter ATP-binding protein [Jatrophihabitans sp.]
MRRPTPPTQATVREAAVALRSLRKVYGRGSSAVPALGGRVGIDLDLIAGSFTAVMGQSGSGKSTLLHCAAGLDRPSAGEVWWASTPLERLSETALTRLRRRRVGFVFQSYNLVSALTVRENILLPLRLDHARIDRRRLAALTQRVGIDGLLRRRPAELSGGQQQRVAVARALLPQPDVIFCDEPTGALDSTAAAEVLSLLRDAVDQDGRTVVMVTHDPAAASYADRVVFLADGQLADDIAVPGVTGIAERLAQLGSSRTSFVPAGNAWLR